MSFLGCEMQIARPRRFGKSVTAYMLAAYYSKGCESEQLFSSLRISRMDSFKKHLNNYNVIRFDTQWCMVSAGKPENAVSFITEEVIRELKEHYPDINMDNVKSLPDVLSCINMETEVQLLCQEYHKDFNEVKRWYDGYLLGDQHIYNPKAVVSVMNRGTFQSYWSQTGSYESIIPLINKDFDGLKTSILTMLAGNEVKVKTSSFQNDMTTFRNKDDVLTLLIHLGYLAYNQNRQTAFIPNEEVRNEFASAVADNKWNSLIAFEMESEKLLDATLSMNEDAVASGIEKIHMEYVSSIRYNDENSLSSVLTIAYLSTMQYYFKPIRELPTGRGFADYVFIPKPEYVTDYPALVTELKWNKDAHTALQQIKDKKYPESIMQYTGKILLVGISYDKKSKVHQCVIEQYRKCAKE